MNNNNNNITEAQWQLQLHEDRSDGPQESTVMTRDLFNSVYYKS